MKYTYTKETDQNWEYIKRSDGAIIPMVLGNADYEAYLNPDKVEHLTEIIPADEA
jgi:hypothetical protein